MTDDERLALGRQLMGQLFAGAPAGRRLPPEMARHTTVHLFGDLWSSKIVGAIADKSSLGRGVLILPVALVPAALLWLLLAARMRRMKVTP